jgi:cellulose synthase/poly-beta-1,6-N-acetylglucosamine synthase-like glycosyltransferase
MISLVLFWILLALLVYAYAGYALLLFGIVILKRLIQRKREIPAPEDYEPTVCLFVTAYNEKDFVRQKVENSLSLDYPKEKMQFLWVTDGSDDGTPDLLKAWPEAEVHHLPERRGKMHAMNRGVKFVKSEIIVFSDTNTILGKRSIREIVACFADEKVGCVAGEKRIIEKQSDAAAGAGEGIYWKYESWVKKLDAELNSAVGAVGELFAIRTELFQEVEPDTLLDDFIISLRIAAKGYRIAYSPEAYAEEAASLNLAEEKKRKIRIAAGGVQTVIRLRRLLNPFKYGVLSWQYFSHKVLRWTLAPLSLFLILVFNILIVWQNQSWGQPSFYTLFLYLQIFLYLLALVGWYFENKKLHLKILFVPYYFLFVNFNAIRGMIRYFKGKQSVTWEKSKRSV